MTITESVRDYIANLNCIATYDSIVNMNFLDNEEDSFSIEELATEPIEKRFIDGSTIRRYDFVFCSREPYSVEVMQNIDNSNFYELLTNEIEDKNNEGILPDMDMDKYEPLSISVTSNSYLALTEENTAMYQINMRFRYIKK